MNFAKMLTDALPATTRNDLSNRLGAFLATYEQLQSDVASMTYQLEACQRGIQQTLTAIASAETPAEEAPAEEAPADETV